MENLPILQDFVPYRDRCPKMKDEPKKLQWRRRGLVEQGGHFLLQITRFKLLFWICLESNLGGYLYNLKWIGALLYPPTTPPLFPGGGWGIFLRKFLLSIITSKIFELESCATSQIVDLEKLFPIYTVNSHSSECE